MDRQNLINEFLREFLKLVPDDLRRTRADMEKNIKAALNSAFNRMDLITREEFDVQTALLARTRELVEELQNKVDELERQQMKSDNEKT